MLPSLSAGKGSTGEDALWSVISGCNVVETGMLTLSKTCGCVVVEGGVLTPFKTC